MQLVIPVRRQLILLWFSEWSWVLGTKSGMAGLILLRGDLWWGFHSPISMELMSDPVMVATGHTYDRLYIERWLHQGNRTCPVTGMRLRHLELTPNFALRNAIQVPYSAQFCPWPCPFSTTGGAAQGGDGVARRKMQRFGQAFMAGSSSANFDLALLQTCFQSMLPPSVHHSSRSKPPPSPCECVCGGACACMSVFHATAPPSTEVPLSVCGGL
jgi:U-box domain